VSYYSRFCAFCVWYGFNSSYYHINKLVRIHAILCHAWITPGQNASKIVKISQYMAKFLRKLKWLVFSGTRCIVRFLYKENYWSRLFHNLIYSFFKIFHIVSDAFSQLYLTIKIGLDWIVYLPQTRPMTTGSFRCFYRAMLRRARLCDSKSSIRPSVRLSVTFRYDFYSASA